jgi:CHAT domain-containing protein
VRVSDLTVGLVEYLIGTDHLYAVLVDQSGQIQRLRLASCAEAVPRVDLLLDVLEHPYAWAPTQRAKVVRDFSEGWGVRLLPPLDLLRRFEILIIIPHHFLHGVPLHLVSFDGEPLATSHGIAYCSSSTLLAHSVERNRARQFDARRWTFPLDKDDTPPEGPAIRSCLGCAVDILTNKDTAYKELAHAFAAQFSEQAIGENRRDVKNALSLANRVPTAEQARVHPDAICLVCHGHYDPLHPNQSGLLVTGRRGVVTLQNVLVHARTVLRLQDHPFAEIPLYLDPMLPKPKVGIPDPEILTSSELQVHCETDAQLVALFGCSTGTGAVASNDEYVSLAYQWLKAGAASVVANLWEADFPVIADWAQRFGVSWIQRRQPKAIAARDATRRLLADRPELKDQPEMWGSLCLLGDWL